MFQFENLEKGTSGQLPSGHQNGTNMEVSGKALLHGKKILSKVWPLVKIFPFIWCANKISIDPFFLYKFVINYDKKCVEKDNKLTTVYGYLRPFSIFIICGSLVSLVRVGFLKKRLERTICFLLLLIDLGTYFHEASPWLLQLRMAIWPAYGSRKGPNFYSADLFLLKYFLHVILLCIMFTRAKRTCATLARATWAKAAFNLLLYIHGGHVFGGLRYSFAICKVIDCWLKACEDQCLHSNHCLQIGDCNLNSHSHDYKFINEFCPTKTRNTTAYDFGIYHDALESGIVEKWNFRRRVLHSFRWGLQNLSGFSQNIQTSTDAWENIFVISITIYGMMLFVFFIGNMQIYLQMQIDRSEITKRSEMIRQKKQEIERSKSFKKLPKKLKKQIKKYQLEKWEETKGGVEFGNLFNDLPDDLRRNIQRELCLELLKKVKGFERWNEAMLDELCDYVKPVSYTEHTHIVLEGDKIDKILFLVQGKLRTYLFRNVNTGSSRRRTVINHLRDGDEFFGEELVAWFQADPYSSDLPISTKTTLVLTKVVGFALMFDDLKIILTKNHKVLFLQSFWRFKMMKKQYQAARFV